MDKPQAFPNLRRNPLGLGLLAFWLVILACVGVGVYRLYANITHRIP